LKTAFINISDAINNGNRNLPNMPIDKVITLAGGLHSKDDSSAERLNNR
jgi:hypothetical protein